LTSKNKLAEKPLVVADPAVRSGEQFAENRAAGRAALQKGFW
jgi:hypothetical protein